MYRSEATPEDSTARNISYFNEDTEKHNKQKMMIE